MKVDTYYLYVKPEEREGRHYCNKCHSWFDNYHVERVEEPRGEYWGVPCTETMYYEYCPYCGADVQDGDVYDESDIIEEEEGDE